MTDRTALVLGGTSGIGLATARKLHDRGARVHVVGRNRERLAQVMASDPHLVGHRADGRIHDEIAAVADRVGTTDWLIISLSGSDGPGPLADLDLDMLRHAFDDKFWGHLTSAQAVLPYLAADGSVTLLGAITARAGMPGTAGIAAINGAVEALVKPLAVELAPIRVNGVSPGFVDTPWWSGMPDEARQAYFAQAAEALPARHIATAEEIADVVTLAATNPAITGTILEADAGARLVSLG